MPPPMTLKIFVSTPADLQNYLDTYKEKIKFILQNNNQAGNNPPGSYILIIDVA